MRSFSLFTSKEGAENIDYYNKIILQFDCMILYRIPHKLNCEMLDRISVSVIHHDNNYYSGCSPLL